MYKNIIPVKYILNFIFIMIIASSCSIKETKKINYPSLENKEEIVREHGIDYTNIYSNLEDIEIPETKSWISKQSNITKSYYSTGNFKEYQEKISNISKDNKAYYWLKNSNGAYYYWNDNDSTQVLYKRDRESNTLKAIYSATYDKLVHFYQPNPEGTKFILFVSDDTNDYMQVIDIKSKKVLFETTKDMNSQQVSYAAWKDENTILFTGWPNKDNSRNSYLASVNVTSGKIKKIFTGKDVTGYNDEHFIRPAVQYKSNTIIALLVNASEHYDGYVTQQPISNNILKWQKVMHEKDSVLYYPTIRDTSLVFLRYKNGKKVLVRSNLNNLDQPEKDQIIFTAEKEHNISSYAVSRKNIFAITSKYGIEHKAYAIDQNDSITLFDLNYPIPGLRTYDEGTSLSVTTFLQSSYNENYFFIDIDDDLNVMVNREVTRETPEQFKGITTKIVEVESHDGQMVPMTIVLPKNYDTNKLSKGIITAYGAYGLPLEPYYSDYILNFVNQGNIYALAHIRGGSEKGLEWYTSAIRENKKNSWKDLLACSQYLKDKEYVEENSLGVYHSSAGSISAAMAINENPKMFKVSVGELPMLNPLRLGYQENFNSSDNDYDFGNKSTQEGLQALLSLDPIYNLKDGDYPITLMISGEKDELIPTYETAKYIAFLQNMNTSSSKYYLLDIVEGEGHTIEPDTLTAKSMFFFNREL